MTNFITVKMLCNWDTGDGLCQTWDKLTDGNGTYTKNNISIKMVGDYASIEDVNYIIIVNHARDFYPSLQDLSRTIFMKMEPDFLDKFWKDVDKKLLKAKIVHGSDHDNINFNNLEWHVNKTRNELLVSDYTNMKTKGNTISSIISGKKLTKGHEMRLSFALHAQDLFEWDMYGNHGSHQYKWNKYLGSPKYKDDALIPYKYSFACENSFINGYITEKLIDCIVTETLCFYHGAPNVDKFIDSRAYIQLDLKDVNKSIKIIQNALQNNEWEKRLPHIKEAKKKILTELGMFPRLWNILFNEDNNKGK